MASSPPPAPTHDPFPFAGPTRAWPLRPEPLLARLLALLELRPDDLLVQLGCAFRDELLALAERVPLRYQALVVDPSPERLARFLGTPRLRSVAMDPLRFAAYPMQCDRILLEDPLLRGDPGAGLARDLFARLRPAGRLVAVGSAPGLPPREESRAPAPPRASAESLSRALEAAGFEVRRDAARRGAARVGLLLGVKPTA